MKKTSQSEKKKKDSDLLTFNYVVKPDKIPKKIRNISDLPKTVSENNRSILDLPKTVSENNSSISDLPKTVSENNRAIPNLAKTIEDAKNIEGFPHGSVEKKMEHSKPPYYCTFPNLFIEQFVKDKLKKQEPGDENQVSAFSVDVEETRNNYIFNIHPYHTKVPYKAIMRYIEYYTKPGDIILDLFCGTGQTGLAAQMVGDRSAILIDLSPIATWIAYNYNNLPTSPETMKKYLSIIDSVEKKFGWLYETELPQEHKNLVESKDKKTSKTQVEHIFWECVIRCPNCHEKIGSNIIVEEKNRAKASEVEDEVVEDSEDGNQTDGESFNCPSCNYSIPTKKMKRSAKTIWDPLLEKSIETTEWNPVSLVFKDPIKRSKNIEKPISPFDLALLEKIEKMPYPKNYKTYPMMLLDGEHEDEKWGELFCRSYHFGMTHTHHFYQKRTIIACQELWDACDEPFYRFLLTSIIFNADKKRRKDSGPLPLVVYIPQMIREINVFKAFRSKIERSIKSFNQNKFYDLKLDAKSVIVSTQSATDLRNIPDNSIDYVFTDPPFGRNIIYSEANFLWESWLGVFEDTQKEAIISRFQKKGATEYEDIMTSAFKELYRVLKPNRWVTIEFSSTSNKIWFAIQQGLQMAGFIVSDTRGLDKKMGSFKQVTEINTVKKDLIISAYKPTNPADYRNISQHSGLDDVKQALDNHLQMVPMPHWTGNDIEFIYKRDKYSLYDAMVAYFIINQIAIPLNAEEFYIFLKENYAEMDQMYFTNDQLMIYEKLKKDHPKRGQVTLYKVIKTELDAKHNIESTLKEGPKSFGEINDIYMKYVSENKHKSEKIPELNDILEENYIKEGNLWRLPKVENEQDKKELRKRRFLSEYRSYLDEDKKNLKLVRLEVLEIGFRESWKNSDFETIVSIADKIKDDYFETEKTSQLLMYVKNARKKLQN